MRHRSRQIAMRTAILALPILSLLTARSALAQSGALDPTFGTSGIAVIPVGTGDDFGKGMAIQADDRIVIAGYSTTTNAPDDMSFIRLNTDGTLDTSLNGTGKVIFSASTDVDRANAVAIQPLDQKIVIGGFSRTSGVESFAVARFLPNGTPDTTFDGDGKAITAIGTLDDEVNAIGIQSDGKIVAAGFSLTAANRDLALVRYNTDGSLDTTFSGDGKVRVPIGTSADEVFGIGFQSDGKIIVAGYAADGSNFDMMVARFTTNGTLDTTFGTGGATRITFGIGDEYGQGLAVQPDDKIIIAGYARVGSVFNFAIARVDASGALDTTFNPVDHSGKVLTAIGSSSQARSVALFAGGRFAVTGIAKVAGNDDFALARYNADGSLDTNFAGGTVTVPIGNGSDEATSVAIQVDKKIVIAGTGRQGNDDNFAAVRYLLNDCGNGTVDPGEECDGGAVIGGDCCTSSCTLIPAGTVCRAATDICDIAESCDGVNGSCPADLHKPDQDGDGVCDLIDICPTVPDPNQVDSDGDGLGDACDPCTNGVAIVRPRLKITKFTTAPGDDTLSLSGTFDFPAPATLNPIGQGVRLILDDGAQNQLFDVQVPAGSYNPLTRTGWVANSKLTSFNFRAQTPVGGVVNKVKLTTSTAKPDVVKFTLSGRKGGYAVPPLALPLQATFVLDAPTAMTGLCGFASFPGPKPLPACSFNSSSSVLSCK